MLLKVSVYGCHTMKSIVAHELNKRHNKTDTAANTAIKIIFLFLFLFFETSYLRRLRWCHSLTDDLHHALVAEPIAFFLASVCAALRYLFNLAPAAALNRSASHRGV